MGMVNAKAFIGIKAHLNQGTKFSFSNDKIKMLIDYFLDGIAKTSILENIRILDKK